MSEPVDFLFLDLETTGLDPTRCAIIEVAAVLTKPNLVPYASFERLVYPAAGACWEEVAAGMHAKGDLLRQLFDHRLYLPAGVEADFTFWLKEQLGETKAHLAGNSVHFDRGFLKQHMPLVLKHLTHRHLDVTSVRLAAVAAGCPEMPKREVAHRAMADIDASLDELRHYLAALKARP